MYFKNVNRIEFLNLIVLAGIFIIAISIFFLNFDTPWKHFSDQTQSFLHRRLDTSPLDFDKHDYVIKGGKYYWPEGPFPSVLLLPFQLIFGPNFQQGIMQLILIVILLLSLFKLARLKDYNFPDSLYLTSAFLMGSPVVGLIADPKSWFFAQVITVTALTLLLLELETKRRWLLIGILEAILIATRPTSGFIILALVVLLYTKKDSLQRKINHVISFLVPLFISSVALMWFNYARFGNPVDNGYLNNDVGGFIGPLRSLGLFSLQHIPTNFYYYFLASVEPVTSNTSVHLKFPYIKYSEWGLSLLFVAPFFLYSLRSLKKTTGYLKSLWLVTVITLFVQLSYYAPGWVQFGPRYTADFMPILYLLTLYGLNSPKLTGFQKILIIISSLFNVYLLTTRILFQG